MTGADDLDRYGRWEQTPEYGAIWFPRGVAARLGAVPHRPLGLGATRGAGPGSTTRPGASRRSTTAAGSTIGNALVLGAGHATCAAGLCAGAGRLGRRPAAAVCRSRSAAAPAVGWFPLAPREVYVPGYRVSPRYVRDVNVTHVTQHHERQRHHQQSGGVQRDYANRKYPHAVTVVPATVLSNRQPVGPSAARTRDLPAVRAIVNEPGRIVAVQTPPVRVAPHAVAARRLEARPFRPAGDASGKAASAGPGRGRRRRAPRSGLPGAAGAAGGRRQAAAAGRARAAGHGTDSPQRCRLARGTARARPCGPGRRMRRRRHSAAGGRPRHAADARRARRSPRTRPARPTAAAQSTTRRAPARRRSAPPPALAGARPAVVAPRPAPVSIPQQRLWWRRRYAAGRRRRAPAAADAAAAGPRRAPARAQRRRAQRTRRHRGPRPPPNAAPAHPRVAPPRRRLLPCRTGTPPAPAQVAPAVATGRGAARAGRAPPEARPEPNRGVRGRAGTGERGVRAAAKSGPQSAAAGILAPANFDDRGVAPVAHRSRLQRCLRPRRCQRIAARVGWRSIGSSTGQMLASMIGWAAATGWMRSAWNIDSASGDVGDALQQERHQRGAFGRATFAKSAAKSSLYLRP